MSKKKFHVNMLISIASQILSIFLGVLRTLLIPFYLGVEDFGYWQIYILYLGLAGIVSLGYTDGLYLNYAKYDDNQLPLKKIRGTLRVYLFVTCLLIAVLYSILIQLKLPIEKYLAFLFLLPNIALILLSSYVNVLLQVTNQIHTYSKYLLVDKLFFVFFLLILVIFDNVTLRILFFSDLVSRLILVALFLAKFNRYLFGEISNTCSSVTDYLNNIKCGSSLLLANMTGILVLVMGRLFAEYNFEIYEFSSFTFGLSLTNIILMAITAVSVVLYPILARTKIDALPDCYKSTFLLCLWVSHLLFLSYFFIYYFISFFFDKYSEVQAYLNLLILICIFQIKIQLTSNMFYKVMRKENKLLKVNLITVGLIFILMFMGNYLNKSIASVACSITFGMYIRVLISDLYFVRIFKISRRFLIYDFILLSGFYVITEFANSIVGFLLLSIIFVMFSLLSYKDIIKGYKYVAA